MFDWASESSESRDATRPLRVPGSPGRPSPETSESRVVRVVRVPGSPSPGPSESSESRVVRVVRVPGRQSPGKPPSRGWSHERQRKGQALRGPGSYSPVHASVHPSESVIHPSHLSESSIRARTALYTRPARCESMAQPP